MIIIIVVFLILVAIFAGLALQFKWESDILGIPASSKQPIETPKPDEIAIATPISTEVPNMFSTDSPAQSVDSMYNSDQPPLALRDTTIPWMLMPYALLVDVPILILIFRKLINHPVLKIIAIILNSILLLFLAMFIFLVF